MTAESADPIILVSISSLGALKRLKTPIKLPSPMTEQKNISNSLIICLFQLAIDFFAGEGYLLWIYSFVRRYESFS